jgi:hypothetical protein
LTKHRASARVELAPAELAEQINWP